jgi:L-alanine-DL-glutamate epimerase-like enolase superfamily enzyme
VVPDGFPAYSRILQWDIAGQIAGVPVYKLPGRKIRDRVRAYDGAVRFPMHGQTPADYAENTQKIKESKEGFTYCKNYMASPPW